MSETTAELLASRNRVLVVAPAGYGKSHLIAQAISCQTSGKQLVLTHTHAGVRSLLQKLKTLGVSCKLFSVDTIAGFALKYAASFPQSSGFDKKMPIAKQWNEAVKSAITVISSSCGKRILNATYAGMYVDEYQDCTLVQHELIKCLAESLPCRIVGDPLQAIFDFDEACPNWSDDIVPFFERLPDLDTPWRWKEGDKELGDWLATVRVHLLEGEPIDLREAPHAVKYLPLSQKFQIIACYQSLGKQGSTVAIRKMNNQAHYTAKFLKGTFNSMDEVEGKDLLEQAEILEKSSGLARAIAIVDFAELCMSGVKGKMKTIRARLAAGAGNIDKGLKVNKEIAVALGEVAESSNLVSCLRAFSAFENLDRCHLYRYDLWYDMMKSIKECSIVAHQSLRDVAWKTRDRGRVVGRKVFRRTISRTLLIKGLEFEHAIVLNADELNTKELYVAMTRGSRSLTILSASPILEREIPKEAILP